MFKSTLTDPGLHAMAVNAIMLSIVVTNLADRGVTMTQTPLEILSDRITNAHTRIQQEHADINPVVGVNRQMRASGIPADAITIDCLRTNRRILIILHDHAPDLVRYQFGQRNADPGVDFEAVNLDKVSEQQLYEWMVQTFN
ncbi:MAG: hypothetical protein R3309_12165 [Reinekea sp.]|nr:hypothetical protein [Reinekea sp.]MDX1474918.1 hypothetical protein [Reinekea sp.]